MSGSADGGDDPDAGWLVVGLGNPGPRYAGNRHNVGAMVLDAIAAGLGVRFTTHRSRADVAQVRLPPVGGRPGPRAVLAKPTSWMNESGGQVAGLVKYFSVDPGHVLVVHDELDLDFGAVRLKRGGGEAGHNGLRSVSRSLGTRDYCRVRLGVGRPPGRQDPADFVLKDFPPGQREEVALLVGDAADAVLEVLRSGWERAQTVSNTAR